MKMENEKMSAKLENFNSWYIKINQICQSVNNITAKYQLSFDQFLILRELKDHPEIEITSLTSVFDVTKPAISRKVNVLYRRNLILKNRNGDVDQRKVLIELSESGAQLEAKLEAEYQLMFDSFKASNQDDLNQLFNGTDQLFNFLRDSNIAAS